MPSRESTGSLYRGAGPRAYDRRTLDDNFLNGLIPFNFGFDAVGSADPLMASLWLPDANGGLARSFIGVICPQDTPLPRHSRLPVCPEGLRFRIIPSENGPRDTNHVGGRIQPILSMVGCEHQNDGMLMASLGPNKRRPSLTNWYIPQAFGQRLPQRISSP